MKNKIAVLLLALSAVIAPLAARADLIWYEGFNYPDGNLTNVSSGVWSNFSGGLHDMYLTNHILQVGSTGGTMSRSDDDLRLLASAYTNTPQVLYASFTVICTNLPNGFGTYFASFYNPRSGSGGGYFGRVQAFTNGTVLPNTFRIGVTDNAKATNALDGGFPVDLALNTPYQVVERLDPITLAACSVWVNPISESDSAYTGIDSIGFATTIAVNAYAFRQASSGGGVGANNWFSYITNLDTATTFVEALTNIAATNAVAPVIVYQPVGVTNFVGIPIQLSTVANGQGLRGLTYQWYKGTNLFTNPNGNSNILPFSNPQTTDSANYTVVVTTPYGLSVTSAVAAVSISAAPVPPTINSGPNSQTAYVGQNVIFSVAVTSPGNLTYQWKSNNVNIPGQTASTLELDNVQTNFSANYSVGVTNDVVPNGVVSTNAVLTVLQPAKVSIAYLRTLVDPGTYAPTNTTIPYTITGVVTTLTNITSGNTSSYYLQDGTAGINIFATSPDATSLFRPNPGDIVSFTGVLSSFTSGLELYADTNSRPYTLYSVISNGYPIPAPIDILFTATNNLSNINYDIAESLVRIKDVSFGTNAGTVLSTTANQNFTVTNSLGQSFTVDFFDVDLDTAGQTLPAYASSVTGVLYGQSPTFSLAVTRWSDIDTSPVVSGPLNIQYTNGTVVLTWSDPVFNLQSAPSASGPWTTLSGSSPYTNTLAGTKFFRLAY